MTSALSIRRSAAIGQAHQQRATRIDARADAIEIAQRAAQLQRLVAQQVVARIVGDESREAVALELRQAFDQGC